MDELGQAFNEPPITYDSDAHAAPGI